MLDASFTRRLTKDRYALMAFVKGTNLLDEDARNHVAYVVNIAPVPGRGITVGLRGTFQGKAGVSRVSFTLDQCVDRWLPQLCMPHLRTVRSSMVRNTRFSTTRPIRITVNRPANTLAISSWFLFS